MKINVLLGFIVFVLVVFGVFVYQNQGDFSYSHTQAICSGNECMDYEIVCSGEGHVLEMSPISDLVVFGDNWVDTRKDLEFCD